MVRIDGFFFLVTSTLEVEKEQGFNDGICCFYFQISLSLGLIRVLMESFLFVCPLAIARFPGGFG